MTKRIAIIGAGAAGLTAAWRLRNAPYEVQVFEKSRGYTGRAATRSHGTVRYDFGANYITRPPERIRQLLTDTLPHDALATIDPPVWTFDKAGNREPGDPESNAAPRWTYAHGINTLGKLLVEDGNLSVQRTTRIHHLTRTGGAWQLHTEQGETHGPFHVVLSTPPSPQTVAILQRSSADAESETHIRQCIAALEVATYAPQFAYVFGLAAPLPRPEPFHALLNTDRAHPIAWMSIEDDKPGRVPSGQSVVSAQMSPDWTAERVDDDPAAYTDTVHALASDVLGVPLQPLAWTDAHRWRYAAPTAAAPDAPLNAAYEAGLYFAGDYRVGKGRVALAMDSGWTQAERIMADWT
ncbi:NAD/FAD-dependent oxidoreductase [Longimonas halophila]|uniref:NAD/FAD-dependent oxidoreductase n=1 Tax=Longimonas halophila TaxID=1469170 RepID=A0A2H3NQ85_9BACT|nr:FAD-dependent oxidoreductase [Longimonas halophila]PEN09431.1 NAD/FAD-dependent oxidoreductase [Longimonas halophila]